jgi:hypothetical protein
VIEARVVGPRLVLSLTKVYKFFIKMFRGLRTKQTELLDNVYSMDFDVFCLTDTWLNDLCFDCNLFPENVHIFRSDRVSSSKSRGGGILISVPS